MSKIYALYRGDQYITSGTIPEIAAERGIKTESVSFMNTPAYKRRCESRRHYSEGYLQMVELEGNRK